MWQKIKDLIFWMRNQYMLWLMMIFVVFYVTFGLTLYWVIHTHLLQDIATLSDQPWLAHTQTIFGSVYMVANTFFLVATCILLWFLTQELDPVNRRDRKKVNQILQKRWGGFYHPKAWMDDICQILPWMLVFCYTPGIFALCGADMNVITILFYIFVGPTTLLMLTLTIHTCVFRNQMREAITTSQAIRTIRETGRSSESFNASRNTGAIYSPFDEKKRQYPTDTQYQEILDTDSNRSRSLYLDDLYDPAHSGRQTPTAPSGNDSEDEKLLPLSQTNPLQETDHALS